SQASPNRVWEGGKAVQWVEDSRNSSRFPCMRALLSLLGFVIGFLLLERGFAFGISWPLVVSVLGFGFTVLCVVAVARDDTDSLRNWLLAALFLDGFVIWGIIVLAGDIDETLEDLLLLWAVFWFSWQVAFWLAWLLQKRRKRSSAGH